MPKLKWTDYIWAVVAHATAFCCSVLCRRRRWCRTERLMTKIYFWRGLRIQIATRKSYLCCTHFPKIDEWRTFSCINQFKFESDQCAMHQGPTWLFSLIFAPEKIPIYRLLLAHFSDDDERRSLNNYYIRSLINKIKQKIEPMQAISRSL